MQHYSSWLCILFSRGMPEILATYYCKVRINAKVFQKYLSHLLFRWPWMTLSCPVRVCTVPWPSGRSTWGSPTSASHGQPPSTCVTSRERVSNLRIRCSQVRREDEAPHGGGPGVSREECMQDVFCTTVYPKSLIYMLHPSNSLHNSP